MTLDYFSRDTNMTRNMTDTTFHSANDLWFEHFILSGAKILFCRVLPSLPRSISVCRCSGNKDWHEPSSVSGYKRFIHLEVTVPFLNTSCLILEFVGFDPLKKTENYATSCQEVMRQFCLSRLSRNTCGGWSSGGRRGPPLQVRLPRAAKG